MRALTALVTVNIKKIMKKFKAASEEIFFSFLDTIRGQEKKTRTRCATRHITGTLNSTCCRSLPLTPSWPAIRTLNEFMRAFWSVFF